MKKRLGGACLLLWLPLLAAQENGEAEVSLSDVVVTAEKVERRAEEVPASVSTLDGEFSERIAAFDFEDLLGYTGNIDARLNPFGGGTLRIRGFGNPGTNAGSESAVGVVIDGVFYSRISFLSAVFFDLQQTEVLRGPQGTLFGKNASAGLLNVTSNAPEPFNGGRVEALYSSEQERSVRPVFNLAITEEWAVRVAANISRDEGLLRNTTLGRAEVDPSQDSIRGRLRYESLGGGLRADLSVFYSNQDRNNSEFQFSEATDAMRSFAQSFDPAFEDDIDFRTSLDAETTGDITFTGVSLNGDWDFRLPFSSGSFTLSSVTGWAESIIKQDSLDADFTPAPFLLRSKTADTPYRQFSQELRLSSRLPSLFGAEDSLQYTAGIYYLNSDLRAPDRFEIQDLGAAAGFVIAAQADDPPLGIPGDAVGGLGGLSAQVLSQLLQLLDPVAAPLLGEDQRIDTQLDQASETIALFGQAEYNVLPRWYVIAGLRIGKEDKVGNFFSRGEGQLIGFIGEQEDHESRVSLDEREFSPKLGLRWEPVDRLNVFATWSRGTKSGGFNGIPLTPENLAFEQERASSYEIGAKARLLGGKLRIATTAFWTDFDNLQVSTFRDNRFFILNAAEARSRGVELDLNWLPPIPGTALYVALGFNDAEFTRYPNAPAPADSDEEFQDLKGRRLPRAPRIDATITPSYVTNIGSSNLSFILAGDAQYRGKRFLDVDLDQRTLQEESLELNLRASLASFARGWTVTVAARNLGKQKTLSQVLDQPLAPGNFVAIRSDRGRLVTGSLIYEF